MTGRARLAAALFVVAVAAAGCTDSGDHGGSSPSPRPASPLGALPEVPSARSQSGLPAAAVRALADSLHLKASKVDVAAAVNNGKHAVALVRFPQNGKETRRLVSFRYRAAKRTRNRWQVEAASPDLWTHPPTTGSRTYPLTSVAAGPWIGVGGFIDPNVRLVQAAGPTGTVVDRQPVKDGAAVVFSSPGATLTGLDGRGLVFATPSLAGSPGAVGGGDAAVGLGSTFAAEILSPRWAKAADLVGDSGLARYILPPLHEYLASDRARVGRGQKTSSGATFIIDSGPLKWRLTLITEPHGGTVKVRQYTLDRMAP